MATSLICATVLEPTMADLRVKRDQAAAGADLLELRLDGVDHPDVPGALQGRTRPAIVTCRPVWEGGQYTGPEGDRRALLAAAFDEGAEYVDLEWRAGFDDLIARRRGAGIVLSMHDFDGVPADLESRVRAMLGTGAEVVKIAVMARRLTDCLPLLDLKLRFSGARLILIAMGEAGLPTRVLAARFGSPWTYAGEGAAPGQVDVARLTHEFGVRRLTEQSAVYGIVGRPVHHSLSPAMHNAAFTDLGVDAVYLPLPAGDLAEFFAFARGIGLQGASVTTPFKIDVIGHIDHLDDRAARIGAVNTIVGRDGQWHGTNTDGEGLLSPLAGLALVNVRATVLGTGGAARAAAVALRAAGATVTLAGRDAARARRVAAGIGVGGIARPVPPGSWDLLINATPVGTHPETSATAFPEGTYDGSLAYDLVYNPPVTRFLHDAAAAGCRTIGGLDMLVAQAQGQTAWWLGIRPPDHVLRDAARARLASFTGVST